MTVIDEILICANQLANAGNKPTVALVKAKLSQRAPLATVITTLKSWQHQPDFIIPIKKEIKTENLAPSTSELLDALIESNDLKEIIKKSLHQELTGLRNELSDMKRHIKRLSEQLDNKKNT
ncbi:MAG: hypothetical protein V5789_09225 [Colwellia sp.]